MTRKEKEGRNDEKGPLGESLMLMPRPKQRTWTAILATSGTRDADASRVLGPNDGLPSFGPLVSLIFFLLFFTNNYYLQTDLCTLPTLPPP
jgi:hypothetical protein